MYYSLLIDYNGPLRFKNKENLATPKTHLFRVYEFAPYQYMPMYCTVNYMFYHQIRAAVLEFFLLERHETCSPKLYEDWMIFAR